jgi:hypothetical protein
MSLSTASDEAIQRRKAIALQSQNFEIAAACVQEQKRRTREVRVSGLPIHIDGSGSVTSAPIEQRPAVAVHRFVRLPVMVKLYDADMVEHEYGPITVEIPAQTGTCPWDKLCNEEAVARAGLLADMEVRVDLDSLTTQITGSVRGKGDNAER